MVDKRIKKETLFNPGQVQEKSNKHNMTNHSFVTNSLSNDSDFTNSMRDALKIQIPCIIFIKRKRITLCGVVVSVSDTAKPSPIFWDQKSNFVYITKCGSYP